MGLSLELYIGVLLITIFLSGTVGAIAWRNRPRAGAHWLAVLNLGIVIWVSCVVIAHYVDSVWLSLLITKFQYVGIGLNSIGFVAFVLHFVGRGDLVDRKTVAALSIEPAVAVLAVFTNGHLHRSFYTDVHPSTASAAGFEVTHGPLFWLHALYAYLLSLVAVGLLVREIYRSDRIYRLQAAAMIVAAVVPFVGNLLYVSGVAPIDLTPVGFAVTGVALLWAVYRYRLTDVAPVARNALVDNIEDGMFVLDDEDRLADINTTGECMLGVDADEVVGQHASDVFDDYPEIYEEYRDRVQVDDEITLETEHGIRHYEIRISPVEDGHEHRVGRLVVVHDVTERKRREQELERQNEQLEQFASFLSHDLRNPLNVADGYLDAARDTGDLSYLDEVERSHERIDQLIEEALTLAREGQTIEDVEPVSIEAVAREAWENVDTGDAALTVDTDLTLVADRPRALRILENCFRNAVEHGGPDVSVRVGAVTGDDPDERGFYVADDGPGIPEDRRDTVVEMGVTTAEDGTGLGLAIVENIAEAHGWRLDIAESEAGGARLEFRGVETARALDEESTPPSPT